MLLTTEAEALLSLFYREYCRRRNSGVRIFAASRFGDDHVVQSDLAPRVDLEDLSILLWELSAANLISAISADDRVKDIELTREGIAYMDHRFSRNAKSVSEFIANLSPLIPWC